MKATEIIQESPYMAPMIMSEAEKERMKYGDIFTADHIINKMCNVWGISQETLKMRSRKREYVEYRAAIVLYIKQQTDINISLVSLGEKIGRDHSSLIHYLNTYTHKSFVNVNKMVHQIKNNMRFIKIEKDADGNFEIWMNAKKIDLANAKVSEDIKDRIEEKKLYMEKYYIQSAIIKL